METIGLDKVEKSLLLIVIFLVGLLGVLYAYPFSIDFEKPLSYIPFLDNTSEDFPSDFINIDDILIYPDRIVIKIPDASISSYEPTGSMMPVLDYGANGIRIKPTNEDSINIGDIVSFKKAGSLIVHRVIEKGIDEDGTYFITKGDNNNFSDEKIRFSDIKYITIGLIY
ncbi:signal peptidase I [Candidatus Pacearchaeota archaeon]|jgi:hypothetical protein|nr:signal peptidase I [Candidatus Pacearchaeota archaeon]|tara:strand:+ start:4884 stop:5390 length:507 start_codon:yes stop_codon:yes gene_type:complete